MANKALHNPVPPLSDLMIYSAPHWSLDSRHTGPLLKFQFSMEFSTSGLLHWLFLLLGMLFPQISMGLIPLLLHMFVQNSPSQWGLSLAAHLKLHLNPYPHTPIPFPYSTFSFCPQHYCLLIYYLIFCMLFVNCYLSVQCSKRTKFFLFPVLEWCLVDSKHSVTTE